MITLLIIIQIVRSVLNSFSKHINNQTCIKQSVILFIIVTSVNNSSFLISIIKIDFNSCLFSALLTQCFYELYKISFSQYFYENHLSVYSCFCWSSHQDVISCLHYLNEVQKDCQCLLSACLKIIQTIW